MSDAKGPDREPSVGATLGRGAGTAWRVLRGRRRPAGDGQPVRTGGSLAAALGTRAGKGLSGVRSSKGWRRRWFHGVRSGVSAFWGSAKTAFHALFLELSGVVFLGFTLVIIGAFLREYRKYTLSQSGLERVGLAGALSAMFLYFAVSSFWRARRKSRI
jgi:hypothetical protein